MRVYEYLQSFSSVSMRRAMIFLLNSCCSWYTLVCGIPGTVQGLTFYVYDIYNFTFSWSQPKCTYVNVCESMHIFVGSQYS